MKFVDGGSLLQPILDRAGMIACPFRPCTDPVGCNGRLQDITFVTDHREG